MTDTATPARIEGALGFAQVDRILADSSQIVAAGTLDLSSVSSIDSAGVSLLLELTRRAGTHGGRLEIRGAGPQIQALAEFFKVKPLLRFVG